MTLTTLDVCTPPNPTPQLSIDLIESMGPPALWSAESPSLYVAVLTLHDADGALVDCEASQVAFRRTWVDPSSGRLLHNGAALLLRGINRHEHDQWRGKALDEGGMWRDACLMKRLNFNAVRCSHYPTHDRWCELA